MTEPTIFKRWTLDVLFHKLSILRVLGLSGPGGPLDVPLCPVVLVALTGVQSERCEQDAERCGAALRGNFAAC